MTASRTLLKILINTLIGLVLILIWLQFVNLKETLTILLRVDPLKLIPVFIFLFLSPVIRAIRLKVLLDPVKKIGVLDLVFLNGLGMLLNFLIPIRAGEIAKSLYLNQTYNLAPAKALIWVFLDRFLDFLVVLILSSLLLLMVPTNLPQSFILVVSFIFFLSIVAAYLLIFQSDFSKKIVKFLIYLLILDIIKIYFNRVFNYLIDTLSILKRKPQELLILLALSILAYGADGATWYFTFYSLDSVQPFIKMYLGQLLSALTYLIPAAPGYIGSAEASGVLIFSGVFGMGINLASSMIVLFHVLTAIFILIYGVLSVYLLKIDLGEIIQKILRRGN